MTDINNPWNQGNFFSQRNDHDKFSEFAELLFFAYRDFISGPDEVLAKYGFGRAHHRVLHFVNHYPGLRVADLLDILKITKQSLSRVLKQLVDAGYIHQREGKTDRRERLMFVTEKGQGLAKELAALQRERIARALDFSGEGSDDAVRKFLHGMIDGKEQNDIIVLAGKK
jgi:DNA-binding MarR family transcriptional regulator